jgi:hypothetical protein
MTHVEEFEDEIAAGTVQKLTMLVWQRKRRSVCKQVGKELLNREANELILLVLRF